MYNPWTAELWRITAVFGFALVVGLIAGAVPLLLLIGLGVYFGWHVLNLYRLERWLHEGRSYHPPEASGIWGEIFHHIHGLQQRNRQRKRRLAGILGQFHEATAAMPDATVVLGPYGEIQWFNDAARRILGLRSGQDAGQRIDNLVRNPDFVAYLNKGDYGEALQIPSPEDPTLTLNVRVVPYGKDQRLLIARDISHLQRLEQMRRDFVANVSHELRTPLTVVSGFLETLGDGDDACARQWHRSLELMQQQSSRMQRIVEDLLLLSRLETDTTDSSWTAVEIPTLVGMLRQDAEVLGKDKGLALKVECDETLVLFGAEKELHSAFGNLVSNAVRYTPEGGAITIRWYADDAGAHFEVRDTGIGVAPEHVPRLTERFYRVDVGRSRQTGGTGLGLAIVKHVLNRHEARLRIESIPGQGSTFACDFPPERASRREPGVPSGDIRTKTG